MRRFHSYGPVDERYHFAAKRKRLVESCVDKFVGSQGGGGHFFTVWAPRQTGKTWLMRQVAKEIESRYGDRFAVGSMSVQGVILDDASSETDLFEWVPLLFRDAFGTEPGQPATWREWMDYFHREKGIFDRPVILFIDEFDSLPSKVIDRLVTLFRDLYLKQDNYLLHGLALVGVRAVLGVDSLRGSPFNIQRSLHVPNFSLEEVEDLFHQYEVESNQPVEQQVVRSVFDATRGQPGLVGWFGELLTEKYNPGTDKPIAKKDWQKVYRKACHVEWNTTVLNLIKKAQAPYTSHILDLFSRPDLRFSLDMEWCGYLYLNGIVDFETATDEKGVETELCRFSSPFIQERLYNALTNHIVGDRLPILALEPLDDLSDVFETDTLDLPALLGRYKDYLQRMKAKGMNPWKDQPRRSDLHQTEAVGHFHLYFWLQNAVGRQCAVCPEFPTGNGKVDLHLQCGKKRGLIEVKSFIDASQVKAARTQAACYA